MRAAVVAIFVVSFLPATALAEPEEAEELTDDAAPIVIYQQVSTVEFDGLNVKAGLVGPSVGLVDGRPPSHFDSLVLLRKNWDRELVESLTEAW